MARTSLMLGAVAAGALVALGLHGCGGGSPSPLNPEASGVGEVSGLVIKGPVADGAVTAYRLDGALVRGASMGEAKTDASGAFTIKLRGAYSGPLAIVASSGKYTEEALGSEVELSGRELVALVPAFQGGQKLQGVRVTPMSTLAAAAARFHIKDGVDLGSALGEAFTAINATFGAPGVDWRTVTPADLTVPGVTTLTPEARAGLVLAGLSQLAQDLASESKLTPGTTVHAMSLTTSLALDLGADGKLNGVGAGGTLREGASALDDRTARCGIAKGIVHFVQGERNKSALRVAEVRDFVTTLAGSGNQYLFAPGATPCIIDFDPPAITFVHPVENAGVKGAQPLEIRAEDPTSRVAQLRVVQPPGYESLSPEFSNSGKTATLKGTLNVGSLPDGPMQLTVEATDEAGNRAQKTAQLVVANRGPNIQLSVTGGNGSGVRGTVTIVASASPASQSATITSLEVRNPPPGLGTDTLPANDNLAITWDTTRAPEGLTHIVVRATDSFGAYTDESVEVNVDNVPFGTFRVKVSAGNPIAAASVRVVAIDNATGLPTTARGVGGEVLGAGGPTEADGTITVTLTGENWDGPVQLQAFGTGLSYVDPSDGTTNVNLGADFKMTSYLASYRTGTQVPFAPVTLTTTLADSAALALSQGRNLNASTARPLTEALSTVDALMARHVSGAGNPVWPLRTTFPLDLTARVDRSINADLYASLTDVALNQLARIIASDAGLTPGTGFDATKLVALLVRDFAAPTDGRLDGTETGSRLQTNAAPGRQPYQLDANTFRIRLATALDVFMRGSQNRTNLTRSDLQGNGVFDAMALDASLLFDPSQPTQNFDNVPPTATLRVSFTGDDGQARNNIAVPAEPAGASVPYVANALSLVLEGSDGQAGSGMKSTVLTLADGTGLGGTSSPSSYSATYTPGTDGELRLRATVTDLLDNVAHVTFVVRVDNTPPTIPVPASPVVNRTYGRTEIAIQATATDPNAGTVPGSGVVSLETLQMPGATDGAEAVDRIDGRWPLDQQPAETDPAAAIAVAARLRAQDGVGNFVFRDIPFRIDRRPPALTWSPPPPSETNQSNVVVTVAASDATAVGTVFVLASTSTTGPVEATPQGGGLYRATVPVSGNGDVRLTAWATDTATPANAGNLNPSLPGNPAWAEPYTVAASIMRDTGRPVPELVTQGGGRYNSEQDASVRTYALVDGDPNSLRPVMPLTVDNPGGPDSLGLSPIIVYKWATRLTPTSAVTAAALEGSNPDNVPWLRFRVPYDQANSTRIETATYTVACSGCANTAEASGTLVRNTPLTQDGPALFDLPITTETVPALQQVNSSPVTLTFRVRATDKAGNTTNDAEAPSVSVQLHVLSPPLVVVEDTNYPNVNDPLSPYAYDGQNYGNMWTNPVFNAPGGMRIARFRVFNPHGSGVWAALANLGGSADFNEGWSWERTRQSTSGVYDGHYFASSYTWAADPMYLACKGEQDVPLPCAGGEPAHVNSAYAGGPQPQYTCNAGGDTGWRAAGLTVKAYRPNGDTGQEAESALLPSGSTMQGATSYLVPGAAGGAAGEGAFYIMVPRSRPKPAAQLNWTGSGFAYEWGLAFERADRATYCRDPVDRVNYYTDLYLRTLINRRLQSVPYSHNLSFQLYGQVASAGGTPTGAIASYPKATVRSANLLSPTLQ